MSSNNEEGTKTEYCSVKARHQKVIHEVCLPLENEMSVGLNTSVVFVGYRWLNGSEIYAVFAIPKTVSENDWLGFADCFNAHSALRNQGSHQWFLTGRIDQPDLDPRRLADMGLTVESHELYGAAFIHDTGGVL